MNNRVIERVIENVVSQKAFLLFTKKKNQTKFKNIQNQILTSFQTFSTHCLVNIVNDFVDFSGTRIIFFVLWVFFRVNLYCLFLNLKFVTSSLRIVIFEDSDLWKVKRIYGPVQI